MINIVNEAAYFFIQTSYWFFDATVYMGDHTHTHTHTIHKSM